MVDLSRGHTDRILRECDAAGLIIPEKAYVLATAAWETNHTLLPVKEAYFLGSKAEAYRQKLRYYPWYGRGQVQLTWEFNYRRAKHALGVDLLTNPELALDPDVAARVLVHGMIEGWFTGKSLSDYITATRQDYRNARRIINGIDCAAQIAALAAEYEGALTPEPDYPNVRIGSRGAAVTALQELLGGHGLSVGEVDGIFGARTRDAVLMFQKTRRLTADGIVGPATWAEILKEK